MPAITASKRDYSYESLAAGMHKEPTFGEVQAVIDRDFKFKTPDRRYLQMWNSPGISNFRGLQEEMAAQA